MESLKPFMREYFLQGLYGYFEGSNNPYPANTLANHFWLEGYTYADKAALEEGLVIKEEGPQPTGTDS